MWAFPCNWFRRERESGCENELVAYLRTIYCIPSDVAHTHPTLGGHLFGVLVLIAVVAESRCNGDFLRTLRRLAGRQFHVHRLQWENDPHQYQGPINIRVEYTHTYQHFVGGRRHRTTTTDRKSPATRNHRRWRRLNCCGDIIIAAVFVAFAPSALRRRTMTAVRRGGRR